MLYCIVLLGIKDRPTIEACMQKMKNERPLHQIMRKHAKADNIQKRQSDLLMTYASKDHKAVAQLIQKWLNESQ